MNELSLQTILEAFNAPLTEEQAWALCYQCAAKLLTDKSNDDRPKRHNKVANGGSQVVNGDKRQTASISARSVLIDLDGSIISLADDEIVDINTGDGDSECACCVVDSWLNIEDGKSGAMRGAYTLDKISCELPSVIQALGVVVFQALDYGLSESEEQLLSVSLGQLIERMTNANQLSADEHDGTDEGIVDDGGFDKESLSGTDAPHRLTLSEIVKICTEHVESTDEAAGHYKAVCRALVAEAHDLTTFLEKVHNERQKLKLNSVGAEHLQHLESLQRTDWARLWMQIMRELRNGVKLKKVQTKFENRSIEYELTPYEIMMDDVRYRRYTLNKVSEDEKLTSVQVKKDVHAMILEFIRSRPPLHPVSSRKLCSPPAVLPDPHDQLLRSIRDKHNLRPTPVKRLETSRTRLDDKDEGTANVSKKVIKPDLSLFVSNSFDDDLDSSDIPDFAFEEKSRIVAEPFTEFTPLSPKSPPKQHMPWQRAVSSLVDSSERRHSLTLCQSPVTSSEDQSRLDSIWSQVDKFMAADFSNVMLMQPSVECLSLTIEEVMHIRSVLTKAELECIVIQPELYNLLVNKKRCAVATIASSVARDIAVIVLTWRKNNPTNIPLASICFSCRKTKFGLFGLWSTTCKFCCRSVCSKCVSKMNIPTEHFEHIPIFTLSPGSPADHQHVDTTTGSAPSSPNGVRRTLTVAGTDNSNNTSNPNGVAAQLMSSLRSHQQGRSGKGTLQRSQTTVRGPSSTSATTNPIAGPLMNVCRDCRTMIANIVRASRQVLAQQSGSSSQSATDRVYSGCPQQRRTASANTRNFHLDLKPAYRLN